MLTAMIIADIYDHYPIGVFAFGIIKSRILRYDSGNIK